MVHGSHILTGSTDSTIIKWSTADIDKVHVFCGHSMKINRILCVGNYLLSTSYDRTAKAWSLVQTSTTKSVKEYQRSITLDGDDSDGVDGSISDPLLMHTFRVKCITLYLSLIYFLSHRAF